MLSDMYFEEFNEYILTASKESAAYEFLTDYFYPVKYRDKTLNKYYVDARGQIFSIRKGIFNPTPLAYNYSKGSKGYPKINVDISDCIDYTVYKTISVHRLVCESFHERPIPKGVTKKEWSMTPKSVKNCFDNYWEVHHIDHNTYNYHPSNLEWVSRQENVEKYQDYLKG